ncbi:MAG: FAD-dependent oxidoreductase [Burkholderiaceae bacterium]
MADSDPPVIIIGAGIVGVATAIWLQRLGRRVLLIDRAGPASGTSHGNAGVLAACSVVPVTVPGLLRKAPAMLANPDEPLFLHWPYLPRLTPWLLRYLSHCNPQDVRRIAAAMTPLVADTLAQHQALAADTPAARYLHPGDYLFAYRDKAHFEADAFGWSVRRDSGFEWETLEGGAFRAVEPALGQEHGFAVRLRNHGRISDPGLYTKALADHACAQGAEMVIAPVDGFDLLDGRVIAVLAAGRRLPCAAVVIATGAWSRPLCDQLGLSVPLETERGYHLDLWGATRKPTSPVMVASLKVVATPMDDRLRLAGAVEFAGLGASASRPPFEMLKRAVARLLPGIEWRQADEWMGHRPAPADSIPLIGPVPGVGSAFLAFGHHHVGLTGAPKTGRLLAQHIVGMPTDVPLAPDDQARFGAGAGPPGLRPADTAPIRYSSATVGARATHPTNTDPGGTIHAKADQVVAGVRAGRGRFDGLCASRPCREMGHADGLFGHQLSL